MIDPTQVLGVPPPPPLPALRVELAPVDPDALDSYFRDPGRNAPCHCGSGEKYKRCCLAADQAAWRLVLLKTRQADAARAMVSAMRISP